MNRILFLGTGGSRVMMSRQLLSTGGMILELGGTMVSIDPGPGAIVGAAREQVDLDALDAVILSHRHLDHCGDVNVMLEAMTHGGFRKRGTVFAPRQALYEDPVVLRYLWKYVRAVKVVEERQQYECGALEFESSIPHRHGDAETYGFIFRTAGHSVAYIPDTRYFEDLGSFYSGDVCVISTLMVHKRDIDHLSIPDVILLVKEIRPQTAVLTHFGMEIWREGVETAADRVAQATGVHVVSARDGMNLDLDELNK